jgi:hypothetical protein
MVLPMPKIVFQMIALSLENIVVFIFRFPTTSTRANHRGNSLGCQFMASDEGILVKHFSIRLTGKGYFAPIDSQGGLGISQWLHFDALKSIFFYPQGKLYPLSKFEFGIAGLQVPIGERMC